MPLQLSIMDHFEDSSQVLVEFPASSPPRSRPKLENEFRKDPACYMLKAVDSASLTIVGTAVWFIYTSAHTTQAMYKGPTLQPHVCKCRQRESSSLSDQVSRPVYYHNTPRPGTGRYSTVLIAMGFGQGRFPWTRSMDVHHVPRRFSI
jgi:hypothetical protein